MRTGQYRDMSEGYAVITSNQYKGLQIGTDRDEVNSARKYEHIFYFRKERVRPFLFGRYVPRTVWEMISFVTEVPPPLQLYRS